MPICLYQQNSRFIYYNINRIKCVSNTRAVFIARESLIKSGIPAALMSVRIFTGEYAEFLQCIFVYGKPAACEKNAWFFATVCKPIETRWLGEWCNSREKNVLRRVLSIRCYDVIKFKVQCQNEWPGFYDVVKFPTATGLRYCP